MCVKYWNICTYSWSHFHLSFYFPHVRNHSTWAYIEVLMLQTSECFDWIVGPTCVYSSSYAVILVSGWVQVFVQIRSRWKHLLDMSIFMSFAAAEEITSQKVSIEASIKRTWTNARLVSVISGAQEQRWSHAFPLILTSFENWVIPLMTLTL